VTSQRSFSVFAGFRFPPAVISLAVRWYLRYGLSYRDVEELLAERGASDIVVFGGGIVPEADIAELERLGVAKIFTPGASTYDIVAWVESNLGGQPAAGVSAQQGS